MIIVLNGYPGVGKLTIGQALAAELGARLLDIHTLYNLAFAMTEFRSPEFWETVAQVEAIAHKLVLARPMDEPTVFTTVLTTKTDRERREWQKLVDLARARPPLCVVHVGCDLDENIRRITSEGRASSRKPQDPEMARRNHANAEPLAGLDAPRLLELDTTGMTPKDAAQAIAQWCEVH